MAALVAVMIMVSVGTMDWHSLRPSTLRRMPRSETLVMVVTVAVVVVTHNLAIGVIVGVVVAMVLFARRVAHFTRVTQVAHPDPDTVVYAVEGELFFASSNDLVEPVRLRRRPGHTSSSTCRARTSGTPRPSPPSTPSRRGMPPAARP